MSVLRVGWPVGHCLSKNYVARLQNCLRPQIVTLQALAGISTKANMMGYQRPKPFPYKEKDFNLWYHIFDKTSHRFDENTKVVIVDGPIAAGKSTLAKTLAEDLDMKHFPEASLDSIYINAYGYDQRSLNKILPPCTQMIDVTHFYNNPHHENVGAMQINMLIVRFMQYCEGLAHILNTGQGVVLERSVYSDFVFMEAMFDSGYVSPAIKKVYDDLSSALKNFIFQPHLVLYLDVPIDIVKKRIKERNRDYEVNTKVLTDRYLTCLERQYKNNFLRQICQHAEVVLYDWSNFGDAEVVAEDIERIDFDKLQKFENKFWEWGYELESDWAAYRMRFTDPADIVNKCMPNHFVPELVVYHEDTEKLYDALESLPGQEYQAGYNPKMGDNVWFK